MAAAAALLVPVTGTATANAKSAPVVKSVAPKKVFVGETMKIRGRHFRRGATRTWSPSSARARRPSWCRRRRGTTKLLMVELPKRLEKILLVQNGTPVPTPLQVRVLSSRFGKRYTSRSKSPLVGPEKPPAPPKPKAANPNGDCDGDGQINRVDTDDDNDLLTDDVEKGYDLDSARPTPTATRSRTATSTSRLATSTTTSTRRPTTTSRTRRSVRTRTRSTRRTPAPTTTATT